MIYIVLLILFIIGCILVIPKKEDKGLRKDIDLDHVNQNSFQNYAKFYGEIYPDDQEFDWKLRQIYDLILKQRITDIKQIAEMSNCQIAECVLKIRYLKNKRLLGDYYIDTNGMRLIPCSTEDEKLLEKYKPFLYGSHVQVAEMAQVLPNPNQLNLNDFRDGIWNDIVHLNQKGLINGIKLNEVDKVILYYTIEKRKVSSDYETVHCPNCGALNDVDYDSKTRCSYCKMIIKGRNGE